MLPSAEPSDLHVPAASPRPGIAALLSGVLWGCYGVLEMLAPWGVDAEYDEDRGHDVVLDRGLFVLYSLPGALALVLSAVALLGLLRTPALRTRAAVAAARVALALGGLALAGVAAGFDPLFTAPRIFGTLALGVAAALAARRARSRGIPGWGVLLALLAALGIALLPLWPVVHALGCLTPAAGTAVIGAHGAAWLAAGLRLVRRGPGAA